MQTRQNNIFQNLSIKSTTIIVLPSEFAEIAESSRLGKMPRKRWQKITNRRLLSRDTDSVMYDGRRVTFVLIVVPNTLEEYCDGYY